MMAPPRAFWHSGDGWADPECGRRAERARFRSGRQLFWGVHRLSAPPALQFHLMSLIQPIFDTVESIDRQHMSDIRQAAAIGSLRLRSIDEKPSSQFFSHQLFGPLDFPDSIISSYNLVLNNHQFFWEFWDFLHRTSRVPQSRRQLLNFRSTIGHETWLGEIHSEMIVPRLREEFVRAEKVSVHSPTTLARARVSQKK
jgi:hypothetical protein